MNFDQKIDIDYLPARQEVYQAYSDHSKAKQIFNIKSFTDINQGIKNMIKAAQELGPIRPKKFKNIETKPTTNPAIAKPLFD